ncbi:hypothetical protein LXL04_019774 [Taraxacum kok-saghyz]
MTENEASEANGMPPMTVSTKPAQPRHYRRCQTRRISVVFAKELLEYDIFNTSNIPHIWRYNDTTYPDDHVNTYEWMMTSLKLDERFWGNSRGNTFYHRVKTQGKSIKAYFKQFIDAILDLRRHKEGLFVSAFTLELLLGKTVSNIHRQSTNVKAQPKIEGQKIPPIGEGRNREAQVLEGPCQFLLNPK